MKKETKKEKKPQVVEIHIYIHQPNTQASIEAGGGSGTYTGFTNRCTCSDVYYGTGTRPPCPIHPNGFV